MSLIPVHKYAHGQSLPQFCRFVEDLPQHGAQLKAGSFEGTISYVKCQEMQLAIREASVKFSLSGEINANRVVFMFPLTADNYIVNGLVYAYDDQICMSESNKYRLYFPSHNKHLLLIINPENLVNYLTADELEQVHSLCGKSSCKKVDSDEKRRYTRTLVEIHELLCSLQDLPKSKLLVKDCIDSVMQSLGNYVLAYSNNLDKNISKREKLLARALEYIAASDPGELTLSSLCDGVHSSSRALQYCFAELMGISPKKYIIMKRFNAIHKTLLESSPQDTTITQVANRYGVANIGRFSQDYEKFFNEHPRSTLIRAS